MKTTVLFYLGILLICGGCGSIEDEPPRTENIEKVYKLPQLAPLTTEERSYVKALRDEYQDAIRNVKL